MCHDRMCKALSAAEFLPFLGPMRQSVRAFQENTAQTNICFCQNQPYTPQLCSWAFACVRMTTRKRTTAFRSGAEGSAALPSQCCLSSTRGGPAGSARKLVEVVAVGTVLTSSRVCYVFIPYAYGLSFPHPLRPSLTGRLQKKQPFRKALPSNQVECERVSVHQTVEFPSISQFSSRN